MENRVIKVALLGLGTVGTGVYKLIGRRSDEMVSEIGAQLSIEKILVHNMKKTRQGIEKGLLTDNWEDIINNDEIQIVIEVMGGIEPARTMILEALEKGKSVVTSNKELVAQKGFELLETARKNNANFLFEASVGGGIPIIRPLSQCLAANEIDEIAGILNGTTNFILTKMINEGESFDSALKTAQELMQ